MEGKDPKGFIRWFYDTGKCPINDFSACWSWFGNVEMGGRGQASAQMGCMSVCVSVCVCVCVCVCLSASLTARGRGLQRSNDKSREGKHQKCGGELSVVRSHTAPGLLSLS